MRLRHKKGAEDEIAISPYCIHIDNKNSESSTLANYFDNNNNLYIELGMGKGKFICEMALKKPNINFIGLERSATIMLKSIETYKSLGEPANLKFICDDVENLLNYFAPHSIDKIFLNFSDPWPKKRHESRRLTHRNFLSLYENLLIKNGIIEFKTDNKDLFDFSLEEIKSSHFSLLSYTYDLHADTQLSFGNIMTEYEAKFSSLGNAICKFVIQLNYLY